MAIDFPEFLRGLVRPFLPPSPRTGQRLFHVEQADHSAPGQSTLGIECRHETGELIRNTVTVGAIIGDDEGVARFVGYCEDLPRHPTPGEARKG